jgi:hypothetical protein
VKKEAMESSIEEQLRDKEAVQAENAAQQALCLQHEAEVRGYGWHGPGERRIACFLDGLQGMLKAGVARIFLLRL